MISLISRFVQISLKKSFSITNKFKQRLNAHRHALTSNLIFLEKNIAAETKTTTKKGIKMFRIIMLIFFWKMSALALNEPLNDSAMNEKQRSKGTQAKAAQHRPKNNSDLQIAMIFGNARVTNSKGSNDWSSANFSNLSAGMEVSMFQGPWQLVTGLTYSEKRIISDFEYATLGSYATDTKFTFVEIPVLAQYLIGDRSRYDLFLRSGVVAAFPLTATTKTNLLGNEFESSSRSSYKDLDLRGLLGGGFILNVSDLVGLTFQADYQQSMFGFSKYGDSLTEVAFSSWNLSVGMLFKY